MKKTLILIYVLSITVHSIGQTDLSSVYRFLTIPSSAYTASLGGSPIASADSNINFVAVNPALLKPELHQQIGMSYTNVHPGVNMGLITWGYDLKKHGFLATGIQYMSYGDMDGYDRYGNATNVFTGGDYAFITAWSQQLLKNLRLGASVKGIYSEIERYNAFAAAFDAAMTYNNANLNLTISFVAKNIGAQIDEYVEGEKEPLPQDFQFGISKGLEHAPFRFSLIAHHLHKTNLLLKNKNTVLPNNTNLEPEEIETDYVNSRTENIMRHLIFGVELAPSEKFSARVGYNYYQRSTMKMRQKGGMVGFSMGATIRIKGIYIGYARNTYHLAGSSNHISIRTNLKNFY